MESKQITDSNIKATFDREDITSKKTKSNQKGNKSEQNNGKNQRNAFDKKDRAVVVPINRSIKSVRNQRNYSAKGSKCSSELEYKSIGKGSKTNQDLDGKTQINKEVIKLKNKVLQEELEHEELVREGLAKSNEKKLKIGSRKRQIISHDILHPPINISSKKEKNVFVSESQRIEQKQYQEIANDVKLNNLESKIINHHVIAPKKQETFLAKIQQSESEIMASPINNNKLGLNTITDSPESLLKSTTHNRENHEQCINGSPSKDEEKSLFKMDSIEEQAINESVERTFKDKQGNHKMHSHKQWQQKMAFESNHHNIKLQPCISQISEERQTEKKSNKVQQSKVVIVTKIGTDKQQKKGMKDGNKLSLITGTIGQNIKILPEKDQNEEQQKRKLNEQINLLKMTVRELKLQKIKARAELNVTIDVNSYRISEQLRSRYQTLNASVSDKNSQSQQLTTSNNFGRIRKNRTLSRKKPNYSMRSHQLTLQKQLDLPEPLINAKKLPLKMKFDAFLSERKLASERSEEPKQYKTMNLEKIAQENMQESMRFHSNLVTSIDMPVFGSQFRSNKIRGAEICNEVLNKFQSSDRKFKNFINLSSSRSKTKTNHSRVEQQQKIIVSKNPSISKQTQQLFQTQQNAFEGVIIKNNYIPRPIPQYYESIRGIELKNSELIKEGQRANLIKCNREFKIKCIPKIPKNPIYSTPTEELMELILEVLPYAQVQYTNADLQDCILKKYKNCIMFELKRFSQIKIVWYYNGKLYIGQWNSLKNEKSGYGRQYSKNKSYFEGSFKDNKRSGVGSFISEACMYQGQWMNGSKQGNGKYYDNIQISYYEGEWKNDKKHGKGHYQFQDNIFQGIFEENNKQGFGVQFFKNGDRYIGNFSHGKFAGEGKYVWQNRSFYLGNFKDGFRQGMGKWQSGTDNYQLYIGEFLRDKKQGTGKYIWNNRCVYEGSFFNDLKHGLGSILYPDGRYMQGIWTQGILTEVLSKVAEANKQEPLQQPKSRTYQSKTIIRAVDIPL